MSLTLPTTGYDDQVKLGNIVENWVFQLGYDEAYDAASTSLFISINDSAITFALDSSAEFAIGDKIKIEDEVMLITDIAGAFLFVIRGYEGTTAASHTDTQIIYFYNFLQFPCMVQVSVVSTIMVLYKRVPQ